ncbi:MAG: hypothetical protein WBN40_07985, partial [Pseudomonadales bacterium]
TLLLWALLLSAVLLATQNLQFHVHDVDHHPVHAENIAPDILEHAEHKHINIVHLSIDISHSNHHQSVVAEIDTGSDRIAQQSSNKLSLLDFVAICVALIVVLGLFFKTLLIRNARLAPKVHQLHLSPPLRAPPQ